MTQPPSRSGRTPTVCIVTGSHLCRNPRAAKEAATLAAAGYSVITIGPRTHDSLAAADAGIVGQRWTHLACADLQRPGVSGLHDRLVRRAARELIRWGGRETPAALGYGVGRALAMARALEADLYIGHEEVGLWIADRLAAEGATVGVDLEDWYSEDLLPADREARPLALLRACEEWAVRRGGHLTTTSEALARAVANRYGGSPPSVVYNAFPWTDRTTIDGQMLDREEGRGRPSLLWVSQVIGPGRGLDQLFGAIARVQTPIDLHLRGGCAPSVGGRLRAGFPTAVGHRLYLHDVVERGQLLSRIAEHDIGLALEEPSPANKNLTVSNKMLHYLLAGLAVVATDTEGQREVAAAAPEAVQLCHCRDEESLAAALGALVSDPDRLARAKAAALESARTRFCWERQEPVLLESVARALTRPQHPRRATPLPEPVGELASPARP